MDRLFLRGLVEELASDLRGARVREATVQRDAGVLELRLFLKGQKGARQGESLFWSFLPGAAGPFLGSPRGGGKTTPALKKRLSGAILEELSAAPLDRIVTLSSRQTRLSGRAEPTQLILEVLGARCDLFVIDGEIGNVLEAFSFSRPRYRLGERYRAPLPPPSSSVPAADGRELERRLRSIPESTPRRSALLSATGWTPLLVRELEWLVSRRGLSEAKAFDELRARLDRREPVLYVAKRSADPGVPVLLSPLELESESRCESKPVASARKFSGALAAAADLLSAGRVARVVRSRIAEALRRRSDKARRLERKLLDERASLAEPAALRRRGESLLAALRNAKRLPGINTVVVPDLYDPEQREIEIEIDPRFSLAANAERLFARAKKSERSREEIEKRIHAVSAEVEAFESLEVALRDAADVRELLALEQELVDEGLLSESREPARKSAKRAARLGPRRFLSHRGASILVGRSGRSNEELTFAIAKPDDLWFHAVGSPGAHVVLRREAGFPSDEREVEEAAGLAAYFSKRREEAAVDVMVTERRSVSKIKGAPKGLVKVRDQRTLRVTPRLLDEQTDGE